MGKAKPVIIMRVDGGNVVSLGLGHVYRCLKVARKLVELGFKVSFVMKSIGGGVSKVLECGYRVDPLPIDISIDEEISSLLELSKGKILFVDVRHWGPECFSILKGKCLKIVMFDDLGSHDCHPDVIVNPTICPMLARYENKSDQTTYLIGEKYFILGEGFKRKSRINQKVERILVSLGGADPAGYTCFVVDLLGRFDREFSVKLILGKSYDDGGLVESMVRMHLKKFEVLRNVSNMGDLMYESDFGIVSGGDTALELAYTGTPGMIVPTISYERVAADRLDSVGAFYSCGDLKVADFNTVIGKMCSIWDDYDIRRRMSATAQGLIDGNGIERVIRSLKLPKEDLT